VVQTITLPKLRAEPTVKEVDNRICKDVVVDDDDGVRESCDDVMGSSGSSTISSRSRPSSSVLLTSDLC
jgi:hypothetical protein